MKRMHRILGRAQRQAKPLTRIYLGRMIQAQDGSPRDFRNKILLLMGYKTMRQRSELIGFEFEDLTCLLNGKPAFKLRISKDLEKLIAKWRSLVGCKGKILSSVDRHGNIS